MGLVCEHDDAHGERRLAPRNRIFEQVFHRTWVRDHLQTHDFTSRVYRWVDGGRETKDLLTKPADITNYEKWAQRRSDLTADERDFLVGSQSQLERHERRRSRRILFLLGIILIPAIFIGIRFYRFSGVGNQNVLDQKRRLGQLRADYETMAHFPERRATVRKEAPEIATVLSTIEDSNLLPIHRIVKYQYTCFAYIMAAAAFDGDDTERDRQRYYLDMAISACRRGLELLTRSARSGDKAEQEAARWAREDNGHNRMHYLRAMALSMKSALAANGQDSARSTVTLRAEALAALGEVEQDYRRRSQPMETPELRFVCPKDHPPTVCDPPPP